MFLAVGNLVVLGKAGFDAHAYYSAWSHRQLYGASPESNDAYLYSPAFAELIWPLTLMPWPMFCVLWLAAMTVGYLWLLAPLPPRWRAPLLVLALSLDSPGNVWVVFAFVLVFGFGRPAAWAFPALTKVTPFLGPAWFAARREWRNLALALGVTAAIVAVSVVADARLWSEWLHFLAVTRPSRSGAAMLSPPTPVLLAIELPLALAITIYAARRNRVWLLPVAMVFANPVFTVSGFLVLAAVPRLKQPLVEAPVEEGTAEAKVFRATELDLSRSTV